MASEKPFDFKERRASARVLEGEINKAAEDILRGRKYAASIDRQVVDDVARDMDAEKALG